MPRSPHPDATGLAIARFDFLQDFFERGDVARVAIEDFIAQGNAFARDDQRNADLFAIGPFVA